jgi:hypothetical protein
MYLLLYNKDFSKRDESFKHQRKFRIFNSEFEVERFTFTLIRRYVYSKLLSKLNRRIIEVRFDYTPDELQNLNIPFTKNERRFLQLLETNCLNLDVVTANSYYLFVLMDESSLNRLTEIYNKYDICVDIVDLTDIYFQQRDMNEEFRILLNNHILDMLTPKESDSKVVLEWVDYAGDYFKNMYSDFLTEAAKLPDQRIFQSTEIFLPYNLGKDESSLLRLQEDSTLSETPKKYLKTSLIFNSQNWRSI